MQSKLSPAFTHKTDENVALANPITPLLSETEVAKIAGISIASVRRRRLLRKPPNWIKLGSRVLYRFEDLQAWINESAVRLEGPEGQ